MRIVHFVVTGLLGVGLVVTSIGWYLSAHPGGTRFASCRWQGNELVLTYSYGTGDTVHTSVEPDTDAVVAQLRVDEGNGDTSGSLTGESHFPIAGGPRPVRYPNGAPLDCPAG
jgi:hypothetical protein